MDNTPKFTKQQRDAVFAAALKDVAPAETKKQTVAERVAEWLPQLRKRRAEGYSWKQLADVVARPEIGIKIGPETLRKCVSEAATKGTAADQAKAIGRNEGGSPAGAVAAKAAGA